MLKDVGKIKLLVDVVLFDLPLSKNHSKVNWLTRGELVWNQGSLESILIHKVSQQLK